MSLVFLMLVAAGECSELPARVVNAGRHYAPQDRVIISASLRAHASDTSAVRSMTSAHRASPASAAMIYLRRRLAPMTSRIASRRATRRARRRTWAGERDWRPSTLSSVRRPCQVALRLLMASPRLRTSHRTISPAESRARVMRRTASCCASFCPKSRGPLHDVEHLATTVVTHERASDGSRSIAGHPSPCTYREALGVIPANPRETTSTTASASTGRIARHARIAREILVGPTAPVAKIETATAAFSLRRRSPGRGVPRAGSPSSSPGRRHRPSSASSTRRWCAGPA